MLVISFNVLQVVAEEVAQSPPCRGQECDKRIRTSFITNHFARQLESKLCKQQTCEKLVVL